jgi:hypothetical protein
MAKTVRMPEPHVPGWVRGEGLETREPGFGDAGPPAQRPRRLTVVALDEFQVSHDELETLGACEASHAFVFDPQLGGALVVYGKGRGPDARGFSEGCLGRFSPFGTVSIGIEGDSAGDESPAPAECRRLVVVEGPDATERVIPVDELQPPSLYVEVVKPDEREPWLLKTDSTCFELQRVLNISLEDVAEG